LYGILVPILILQAILTTSCLFFSQGHQKNSLYSDQGIQYGYPVRRDKEGVATDVEETKAMEKRRSSETKPYQLVLI